MKYARPPEQAKPSDLDSDTSEISEYYELENQRQPETTEPEMSLFYCTQCPWQGAATRTVTFNDGELAALLLNRCPLCGGGCEK